MTDHTRSDTSRVRAVAGRAGRRAQRAVRDRIVELFTRGGLSFRDLGVAHAASTAGDTLVTIALAGTLFFSVPTAEARGNVALYLLLTVAPFAVIGPALGALLDRYPSAYRLTLLWSAVARAVIALLLIRQLDSLWLYPFAFTLLVLSRTHGISRNALVPLVLEEPVTLVNANARLARIGVYAGAVVAPFGVAVTALIGPGGALVLSILVYLVAAAAGRRLPGPAPEAGPRSTGSPLARLHLPPTVRFAQIATAVVRLLNGFLVLLLAFAFREAEAGVADFGALLAAAGAGFALASWVSPILEARLREEPMVVAALAVEAAAGFIAAQWFGLLAASGLALAAGFSWGTAKFAFDGLLQSAISGHRRGVAFTRSETVFQLAWVIGGVLPTGLPIPPKIGLVIAGLAALAAQIVYVAHLLTPLNRTADTEPD
ncbi:MAG: hypothetical protein R3343_02020 [Nitriliruptorales bacterium]|nr:hypothetical protein [Nitriliruptorales bacterium]